MDTNLPEKQDLLRMIIHEIRNPLSTIRIANQVLGDVPLQEQETAVRSLTALTTIISRNVLRIEGLLKELIHHKGDTALKLAPVNVCDIIDESLSKAADRIYLKKIEIVKSFAPEFLVYGNAEGLSLAFLNIIMNAIEAMKSEGGKLWITVYHAKEDIKVVFKDNGVGMTPEAVDRMFDNKGYSSKVDGLGVGLSHVKEILEWHQAEISVNSLVDIGTSVVISLRGA
jgi:signal transduction histidine kinase